MPMPVRVLQLINKFTRRSGPERLALSLVRRLDPAQFKCFVAQIDFARYQGASELEQAMAGTGRHLMLPWDKGNLLRGAVLGLRRAVQQWGIQAVHTHDIPADLLAVLATTGMRRGERPALIAARHGFIDYSWKLRFMGWLDNTLLRRFDRVVIGSEAMRATLPRAVLARTQTIANAVDVQCHVDTRAVSALRAELGLAGGDRVVLSVGRAFHEKGHRYLVECLPELLNFDPKVRLVIIGEGPELDALRARARQLGITHALILPGFVEDVRPAYALCEVFAQPSLSESFPLTVFEAMAWSKPVVATDVGGLAEHLREGVTARLVPAGAPEPLGRAILALLQAPAEQARLARCGRELVESNYGDIAYARALGELYLSTCANKLVR